MKSKHGEIGSWAMLKELWGKTKLDCRPALFWEFLTNPGALRLRYVRELVFQARMGSRWKNERRT